MQNIHWLSFWKIKLHKLFKEMIFSQFTSRRHAIAMLLSARSNYFTAWTEKFLPEFSFILEQLYSFWFSVGHNYHHNFHHHHSRCIRLEESQQWRIQDFPEGAPNPKVGVLTYFFAENCMKMKEFGPRGRASPGSPLDPPLVSHLRITWNLIRPSSDLLSCFPSNFLPWSFQISTLGRSASAGMSWTSHQKRSQEK